MLLSNVPILIVALFVVALTKGSANVTFTENNDEAACRRTPGAGYNNIRIGAFNIKSLGTKKMNNATIADIIRKIIWHYDLILIQEIIDVTGISLKLLHCIVGSDNYGLTVSKPLGSTNYKEQYAYFYRRTTLTLSSTYQYEDGTTFERPPYCALFLLKGGFGKQFAVIGVHTKPDVKRIRTVAEIKGLFDVFLDVGKRWLVSDVIIMGDLNAGCDYVKEEDLVQLDIYNKNNFFWPLGFDVKTNTNPKRDCPYDRFVINIPNKMIVPGSWGTFTYEQALDIPDALMRAVSDHYPIQIEIYGCK